MDIKKLIKDLSIQEKAALLSGISNWDTTPIARLAIPSIKMSDGPTGVRKESEPGKFLAPSIPATCFPLPVTSASTWNVELIEKMAAVLGREASDQGIDTILGPGTNIKRSPLGGRNFEYFSEDPIVSAKMAIAFINGLKKSGVGASLKHFALNNQEYRRMTISSEASLRTMREIYLLPFELAIKEADPMAVMASYNLINGVQVTENKWLLKDLLRTKWGYKGLVMSDWGATVDRVKGVQAGLDLEMPSSNGVNDKLIVKAVESGQLSEHDVDIAVTNVLTYIDQSSALRKKRSKKKYDYEEGHDIAKQVAIEGAVLLKNDGILPLKKEHSLALIGSMAKRPRYQGSGSSKVNPRKLVSFIDELDHQGIGYEYTSGIDNGIVNITKVQHIAKGKDAVLLFIGLPDEYESEGFDRSHIDLPPAHLRLIKAVRKVNKNIVVVLSLGAPVAMPFIADVKAILNMYLAGEAFGEAAFELLFGMSNPSGKLAETFPYRLIDHSASSYFPMGPRYVEYKEGIYVGYRHFDKARRDVLFPFGFGLSYTNFRFRNLIIEGTFLEEGKIKLSVDVTNIGTVPGAEVVQVYVTEMRPSVDREQSALKAFKKVSLNPEETKTVIFELDETAFRYFDDTKNDWNITAGDFKVLVGNSSRDIHLSDVVYIEPKSMPLKHTPKLAPSVENIRVLNNDRYTRATLDDAATPIDIKRVSLNGWLLYQGMKLGSTSMVPKGIDRVTRRMVRRSAVMMPLRQLAIFSNGKMSHDGVAGIILIVKGKLFKGLKLLFADLRKNKLHPNKTDLYPLDE